MQFPALQYTRRHFDDVTAARDRPPGRVGLIIPRHFLYDVCRLTDASFNYFEPTTGYRLSYIHIHCAISSRSGNWL